MPNEPQLAVAVVPLLATYLLHSTLLLGAVALALSRTRTAALQDRLWKLAALAPLLTAPLQLAAAERFADWSVWTLPPIAVHREGEAPAEPAQREGETPAEPVGHHGSPIVTDDRDSDAALVEISPGRASQPAAVNAGLPLIEPADPFAAGRGWTDRRKGSPGEDAPATQPLAPPRSLNPADNRPAPVAVAERGAIASPDVRSGGTPDAQRVQNEEAQRRDELARTLQELFPEADLKLVWIRDSLLLRGTVASEEEVSQISEIAEQYAPIVLNQLRVQSPDVPPPTPASKVTDPRQSSRTRSPSDTHTVILSFTDPAPLQSLAVGDRIDVIRGREVPRGDVVEFEVKLLAIDAEVVQVHVSDQGNLLGLRVSKYDGDLLSDTDTSTLRIVPHGEDSFPPPDHRIKPSRLQSERAEVAGLASSDDASLREDIRALHDDVRKLIALLEQRIENHTPPDAHQNGNIGEAGDAIQPEADEPADPDTPASDAGADQSHIAPKPDDDFIDPTPRRRLLSDDEDATPRDDAASATSYGTRSSI